MTKRAAGLLWVLVLVAAMLAGGGGTTAQPSGPTITLLEGGSPLTEGQAFSRAATPVIEITPSAGSTVDAELNGVAFVSGSEIEEEGSYTLSVVAHDASFNESTLVRHFTLDLTAPEVLSIEPANNTLLTAAQVTLTGEVEGATAVTINGSTVTLGTPVSGIASFSGGPYSLSQGNNDFTVVARDAAGNTAPVQHRLVRDSVVPVLTVSSPTAGGAVAASPATVAGTAVDDRLAEVRVNGTLASLSGSSFSLSVTLSAGANSLQVVAKDTAGNTTTQNLSVTLDGQAPSIRVLEAGSDLLDGTTFTRAATPVIEVTDATAVQTTATLDGAAFTSGTAVSADGAHTLVVAATDAAGNGAERTVHFTIDATAPVFLEVLPAAGTVSSEAQMTLTGRVRGAAILTADGQAATLTGEDFTAGPFILAEGTRTFQLVATDAAGNATPRSHAVVRDSTPPQVSLQQPAAGALLPSTPALVTGSALDPHMAGVTVNGTAATFSGLNFIAANVPLAEGENTLTVVATDRAGNERAVTREVVLDSEPPVLAILDPAAGTVVPGGQITVRGTAEDAHLDRVEVEGVRATLTGSSWTVRVALREGENLLRARANDRLGHVSTATVTVTRDATAPAVAITTPAVGARIAADTVTVSGTVDNEAGISVTVNGVAATVTGGTFEAQGIALVAGENRLIARATDAQDNVGTHTRTVIHDADAPSFVAAQPAGGALAVPSTTVFNLTFSEEMAAPAPGALRLETGVNTVLAAEVTVASEELRVAPAAPLPSGSEVRLVLAGTLADRAGNALANPQTLTFGVADSNAPAAPTVAPVPSYLCASSVTLAGTSEAAAIITVAGGAGAAQARASDSGQFQLVVSLVPSTLHRLQVFATDVGGNRSPETLVEVAQDCVGPEVVAAEVVAVPGGSQIRIRFSEAVTPATVTAAGSVRVATASGALAGSVSLATGGREAVFAPASALPAGGFELTVSQAVHDLAGNTLAYPYSRVFGDDAGVSFLAGRVIDQRTGRPLAGAQVVIAATGGVALPEPQPGQTTGPDGSFQIPLGGGTHLLMALRPGYTPSFRLATTAPGSGTDVFDPRLSPLAPTHAVAAGGTVILGGGLGTVNGLTLSVPAGALPAGTAVSFTALEEQALPALLPYGWSPRAAVWLDLAGHTPSHALSLRLPVAASDGTSLALARLDPATLSWRVVAVQPVEDGAVGLEILAGGAYAAVEADSGATAPPPAASGQALAASTAPTGDEVASAALAFEPALVLPAQRALATVEYTLALNEAAPSGLPLTLVVEEELELLDGGTRRESAYRADLLLFKTGSGQARSQFGLMPSAAARLLPISAGVEDVAVASYGGEAVVGGVVGSTGGTITNSEGDQVSLPAGALPESTAVVLARIAEADLTVELPTSVELVGALSLDLGGRPLALAAALALATDPAPTAGSRGLLLAVVEAGTSSFLRPLAETEATATGWTTVAIESEGLPWPAEYLPWPGVRGGGLYLFVTFAEPHGFLRGAVIDVDDAPLAGAVVTSPGTAWAQLSGALGFYVLPVPVGPVTAVADDPLRGNHGTALSEIATAGERVDLDLELFVVGPTVLEVSPADDATGVPVGVAPTVRFSEAVDRASLAAGIELLEDGQPVPIDFDHRGALVTLLPRSTLVPGSSYEIRVGSAVRDLAGYALPSPWLSQFSTQAAQATSVVDLTRVLTYAPNAQGIVRVVGRPGAVPPGTLVAVENRQTATTVSATAAADGSFEILIPAEMTHSLMLLVFPAGANQIVLPLGRFVSPDGRTAFVGASAGSFTTIDGITVSIEAGTFSGPSTITLRPVAVNPPAPRPTGVEAIYSFELAFGALTPAKRIGLELPVPTSLLALPPAPEYLVARQLSGPGGRRYYMLFELLRRAGNRLTTAPADGHELASEQGLAARGMMLLDERGQLPDQPGPDPQGLEQVVEKDGAPLVPRDSCSLGLHAGGVYHVWQPMPAVELGMIGIGGGIADMIFETSEMFGANAQATLEEILSEDLLCIPTLMDQPLTIEVLDARTGMRLFSGVFDPPADAGSVLVLPPEAFGDERPPLPVGGSPLRFLRVDPSGEGEVELDRDIRLTRSSGSITILGEPGAADPEVQVRLLQLAGGNGQPGGATSLTQTGTDGSFSLSSTAPNGARFVLAIGARIGPAEPLEISFSEALDSAFPGLDVLDESGHALDLAPRALDTGARVRVEPPAAWQAGKRYTLRLAPELADAAGNRWGQQLDIQFEVEESKVVDTYPVLETVRDFAQLGSWMFVAAGDKGLAVLDISNPADLKSVLPNDLTFPFAPADEVRGVTVDPHGRVLVVGGGLTNQGLLRIFDPFALDPQAVAANPGDLEIRNAAFRGQTRISDPTSEGGLGTQLRSGFPQKVAVLSQDDRDTWLVGEAPPAALQVTPGALPTETSFGPLQPIAITVSGNAVPKLPVTIRNLSRGLMQREDAGEDGFFSLTVQAYRGDRIEVLRNRASVAYVAVLGVGIVAVDVNYVYLHPELGTLDILAILGIYDEDPLLTLCNQPRFDFGGYALDVGLLLDAASSAPITLAALALQNGPALVSSNPSDVGDMRYLADGCAEGDTSRNVNGLEVVQKYRFDLDGDGRLSESEERDYVVVSQSGDGVFVFDVTDRKAVKMVGMVPIPGQARNLRIDPLNRRLYVAGTGSGLFIVDFDAKPALARLDANGDGIDDRVIETVDLDGFNTLAPPWVLPELGVVFTGGLSEQGSSANREKLSAVAVGSPKITLVANRPENGEWQALSRLAPLGVPQKEDSGTEGAPGEDLRDGKVGAFRLLAALPGTLGEEIELSVESVGPGGVRIDGLGDPQRIAGLPATALVGEDAVVLKRQSDNPLDDGYSRYLSEEIVAIADARAARDYSRSADEDEDCTRCDQAEEKISAEAQQLLSGDAVAVRLPAELRTELAELYSTGKLDAAETRLPSVRWELVPALRQEPPLAPSYGTGDAAPGTLLHSGEMSQSATDLAVKGRGLDFVFSRTYRSQTIGAGPLGPGWDHGYRMRLRELPNGDVEYYDGRGRRDLFEKKDDEEGAYESPQGRFEELTQSSAGWLLIDPAFHRLRFDHFGRLTSVIDAVKQDEDSGSELTFFYDAASRLVRMEDALERSYTFEYDDDGLLTHLEDFDARQVQLEYDDDRRLTRVTSPQVATGESQFPNGLTTEYAYEPAGNGLESALRLRDNLKSVTDPKGQSWLELTYSDADGDGRSDEVTAQKWGEATLSIGYDFEARATVVTDRRGNASTYDHNQKGQALRIEDPSAAATVLAYDDQGRLTARTLPLGRSIVYEYGDATSPRSKGNVTKITVTPDGRGANGSASALVSTFSYDERTNQLTHAVDPRGRVSDITRDGSGLAKTVIEAVGAPEQRSTSFEYNEHGQLTQETNANGHITEYEYFEEADSASRGYLNRVIIDPAGEGLTTTFETDARGNVTSITDPRGTRHEREVNELDWLVSATAAAGPLDFKTTLHYDENGNVTAEHVPFESAGSTTETRYEYGLLDEIKQVRREIDGAQEAVDTYEYDANLNVESHAIAGGRQTTYHYDERNLVESVDLGESVSQSFTFDAEGGLLSRVDGNGGTWATTYDGYGRVKSASDPLGNQRATEYDASGNPARSLALAGGATLAESRFIYDLHGRRTQMSRKLWQEGETTVAGVDSTVEYDALGLVKKTIDPLGRVTTFSYDGAERLTRKVDPAGNQLELELDPQGNVTTLTTTEVGTASAIVTETMSYDALGRREDHTDGMGHVTRYTYDARGNVRSVIDAESHTTEHRYDGLNRKTQTLQPAGITETFSYDSASRLVGYADALGRTTAWTYDGLDRTESVTYPDQTVRSYTYDANSNLETWLDANGTAVTQTFDAANRLIGRTASLGSGVLGTTTEAFAYDGLGRMIQAQSGGAVSALAYDSLSRVVSETSAGKSVAYEYDPAGNPVGTSYPSGKVIDRSFDPLNRVESIGPASPVASYGYRGPYLTSSKTLKNGLASTRQFDDARRLTSNVVEVASNPVGAALGELLEWTPRGRQSAQTRIDLNLSRHFDYDAAGRLTKRTETHGGAAEPGAGAPLEFSYNAAQYLGSLSIPDPDGFTSTRSLPEDASRPQRPSSVGGVPLLWDANGNLTGKGNLRFGYDLHNRLVEVRNGTNVLATYAYDAFNRRVARSVSGQAVEETVWSGWQEVESYRAGVLSQRRTYGQGLDEIVELESDRDSDGVLEAGESLVPLYDSTGNLAAVTDGSGKPVERYTYTPYGLDSILVDATAPTIEQLRLVAGSGETALWIETNEEVLLSVIEAGIAADAVTLTRLDTNAVLPLTVEQPVHEGLMVGRRTVLSTSAELAADVELRLDIASEAIQDSFLNQLATAYSQTFTWNPTPASGVVLEDATAPEVMQIAVRAGALEVTFSEEVDLASANGILVDGAAKTWQKDTTGYRLTTSLTAGQHEISVTTGVEDLAGTALAENLTRSLTWSEVLPNVVAYRQADPRKVTSTTTGNPFTFHGRPKDPETGFVYFRNRYYDPEMGRFVTADPLGYVDGPSMYAFALNDPINHGDPLGLANASSTPQMALSSAAQMDPSKAALLPVLLNPHVQGGLQAVGGCTEAAIGLAGTPETFGASFVLALHGFDNCSAGFSIMVTGLPQQTHTERIVSDFVRVSGGSEVAADRTASLVNMAVGVGTGSAVAAKSLSSSKRLVTIERPGLTTYAQSEAQIQRFQAQDGKPPTMTAAVRNKKTGEVFYGTSGKPWPVQIHAELQSNMPPFSLRKWGIPNCAEFQTCNFALWNTEGSTLQDLEYAVVRTADGIPQAPCLNCQQSLRGATHLVEKP